HDEGPTGLLGACTSAVGRPHVLHFVLSAASDVADLAGQSGLFALRSGSSERNQCESSGYHYGPENFVQLHFASPLRLGKPPSAYTRFNFAVTAKWQAMKGESIFASAALFRGPAWPFPVALFPCRQAIRAGAL